MPTQEEADNFSIHVLGAPPEMFGAPPASKSDGTNQQGPASGTANGPSTTSEPDKAPGWSLVNNPAFKKIVDDMVADSDAAIGVWSSQVGDGMFKFLPPDTQGQYNKDGADLKAAEGDFNAEWNKIVFNKGGDLNKLIATFNVFSLRADAIQRSNVRVGALIEINVAQQSQEVLNFLEQIRQPVMNGFEGSIKEAESALRKAEANVTKQEVKAALNLALSGATLLIDPAVAWGKIALGLGGIALHMGLDAGLGNPTATGWAAFCAGDQKDVLDGAISGYEHYSETFVIGKKSLGSAAAGITALLDAKEIDEALDQVIEANNKLDEALDLMDKLLQGELPLLPKLSVVAKTKQDLQQKISQALARGNDAAKDYSSIQKQIENAIAQGG